ncbi:hypothetical protein M6B38_401985 [Iris pallida]|uniref:Uncharacterized protein n=1 Tax=Iris pallida TaxID=29817 RepID=A0AAX6FTH7_IRIPA|nr:hypothetical protein M6B38_401985 [Iris pallida]
MIIKMIFRIKYYLNNILGDDLNGHWAPTQCKRTGSTGR